MTFRGTVSNDSRLPVCLLTTANSGTELTSGKCSVPAQGNTRRQTCCFLHFSYYVITTTKQRSLSAHLKKHYLNRDYLNPEEIADRDNVIGEKE